MNVKKVFAVIAACALILTSLIAFAGCSEKSDGITLRVCNWEEYIDEGDGGEVNSMVDDFTAWFNSGHDFKVKVEYSTFGTNEDLYNRLKLGDEYDLVCPSDYMIMKLLAEGACLDYSDEFWDKQSPENYYANSVSPYIDGAEDSIFVNYGWNKKAACYMWGTTGLVYNPEKINDVADVSTWKILLNENYKRQVTVKDNVRDAYFATLGIINSEKLSGGVDDIERTALLNAVDDKTIDEAERVLKKIKDNVYSFETDAGKADMVTGKVIANYQWSGDAVYILDEAEKDNSELWYSVPDECANLWFDGWLMLKRGIDGNEKRRCAAEAFVNFLSRPDNAVRNMDFIGYTSAIAGDEVYDYVNDSYAAEEGAETEEYDVSYFFGEERKITADKSQFGYNGKNINRGRQLFAQYPPENVIKRSVVMRDFGDKLGRINRMWINVRCLDVKDISPVVIGVTSAVAAVAVAGILLYVFRYRIFGKYKPRKGFEKVEKNG